MPADRQGGLTRGKNTHGTVAVQHGDVEISIQVEKCFFPGKGNSFLGTHTVIFIGCNWRIRIGMPVIVHKDGCIASHMHCSLIPYVDAFPIHLYFTAFKVNWLNSDGQIFFKIKLTCSQSTMPMPGSSAPLAVPSLGVKFS